MKKVLFIIALFFCFQSKAQRFPSVDSLKTYILKYVKNSTVESFTNLRMQNVVYGTAELLTDSIQVYTTGDSVTVNNYVNVLYIDPATTKDTLTIILPSTIHREIEIYFGGTITADTVVNTIIFSPAVLQATVPTDVLAGSVLIYKYRSSISKWYRKQ